MKLNFIMNKSISRVLIRNKILPFFFSEKLNNIKYLSFSR